MDPLEAEFLAGDNENVPDPLQKEPAAVLEFFGALQALEDLP